MVECSFNSLSGSALEPQRDLYIPSLTPPTSQRDRVKSNNTFEVLGPTDNNSSVTTNSLYHYKVKSCVTLVHRQFPGSSWLHSVHFLPEYNLIPEIFNLPDDTTDKIKKERMMKNIKQQTKLEEADIMSSKENILEKINTAHSVRCMIGTSRTGYLYDVSDPRLLSEYSFTEHTYALKLTPSLMYTLTRSGIIVWSIRCCSSAGEKFPAPCVMGIEIAPKARHLVVIGDYFLTTPPQEESSEKSQQYNQHYQQQQQIQTNSKPMLLRTKNLLGLFDEIRSFALLNQNTSYEAYFQLMLELHFLLEAKLQKLNQKLLHNTNYYQKYLSSYPIESNPEMDQELNQLQIESSIFYEKRKESSGALGDYQFRANLYSRAAVFYSESDRLMSNVITPFLTALKEDAKSGARRAILIYLDAILFDNDKLSIMDETPELSDKIIAIYYTLARSKVASVILDSSLSKYNQETALLLLEENPIRKDNNNNSNRKVQKKYYHASSPEIDKSTTSSLVIPDLVPTFQSTGMSLKNIFVRGLLYLDLGQPERAKGDFISLESEVLVEFCEHNPELFNPDILPEDYSKDGLQNVQSNLNLRRSGVLNSIPLNDEEMNNLQTLGKVLYSIDSWLLLEILVRIYDTVPVKSVLRLLKANNNLADLDNDSLFVLECYLEWVLLELTNNNNNNININDDDIIRVFELLSTIYYRYIQKDIDYHPMPLKKSESRNGIRRKWLKKHRCTFIDFRNEWLNQIPPFDSINHFASRSPFSSVDEEPAPPKFYLQKLQGLLCTHKFHFSKGVESLLLQMEYSKTKEDKLSLELLCLPIVGQLMNAVELIIKNCPQITSSYTAKYCKSPEEWKQVLEYLSINDNCYHIYTDIISHLVKVQNPINFVSLLPENGNMQFFLPFIEKNIRLNYASLLKNSIASQAKMRAK